MDKFVEKRAKQMYGDRYGSISRYFASLVEADMIAQGVVLEWEASTLKVLRKHFLKEGVDHLIPPEIGGPALVLPDASAAVLLVGESSYNLAYRLVVQATVGRISYGTDVVYVVARDTLSPSVTDTIARTVEQLRGEAILGDETQLRAWVKKRGKPTE